MGARQSQDQSHDASPVEISTPQTHHQYTSRHHQDLPTLGSYTHLQHPSPLPVLRPHTQPRPDSHPRHGQQRPGLESGDLLELDLALSTLQRRLATRTHPEPAPRDQPQSHHHHRHRHHHHSRSYNAALGSAMPFIFVRNLSCEYAAHAKLHVPYVPNPNTSPSRSPISSPAVKCPLCSKEVLPGNMEEHLVLCMAKPRVTYNGMTTCT